jgi:ParB family chromosome partitioning protein
MCGWADHYDPDEVGPALTDDQWDDFEATVAATVAFADRARTARGAR